MSTVSRQTWIVVAIMATASLAEAQSKRSSNTAAAPAKSAMQPSTPSVAREWFGSAPAEAKSASTDNTGAMKPFADRRAAKATTAEQSVATIPVNKFAGDHAERVRAILSEPLIFRSGPAEIFPCDPTLYDWLLDHPMWLNDFWRALGAETIPTRTVEGGYLSEDAEQRGRVSFFPIYSAPGLRVIYCVAEAKRAAFPGWLRAELVFVHRYRFLRQPTGECFVIQQSEAFLTAPKATVKFVMRLARSTSERMVDASIQEMSLFFSVICRIVHLRANWAQHVIEKERGNHETTESSELLEIIKSLPPAPTGIPCLPMGWFDDREFDLSNLAN